MVVNSSKTCKREYGYGTGIKNLSQTFNEANYNFNQQQIEQLQQYANELSRWNKKINLTSVDQKDFYTHHLLDSLSVMGELKGNHILDMGTGGGLPGVPLAIACVNKSFSLLDARNKKVQFLKFIKSVLALNNIYPIHQRVEEHQPQLLYDTVISRAFTSMDRIYQLAKPLITPKGRIIAMKGRNPVEELKQLDHMQVNYEVKSLAVFGLNAERHLVIIDN